MPYVLGNKLTYLPPSIKSLRDLHILDIRDNNSLIQLPVNLCYLSNLEVRNQMFNISTSSHVVH